MHNYIFVFFKCFLILLFFPHVRIKKAVTKTGRQTGLYSSQSRETDGREWGRGRGDVHQGNKMRSDFGLLYMKEDERLLTAVISQSAVIIQLEIRSSLSMSSL